MRSLQLAFVLAIFGYHNLASAQTVKTTVLGWTGTGGELVTRVEQFGEVMVGESSKDYWFTTTQMLRARDGQLLQTYRFGEPSGAAKEVELWAAAKSADQAAKLLDTAGLAEALNTDVSADGMRSIVTVTRKRDLIVEAGYRCAIDARVLLHDVKTQSVWLVAEDTKSGEDFENPGEVQCPKVSFRTWWHPDGTRWLVEETSGDSVRWLPGSVAGIDDFATAPFQPADFATRVEVKDLPDGGLKNAWKLAFSGDFKQALLALSRDETGSADKVLLMAILFSLNGDTEAAKKVAKEAVKAAKTPWTEGLLGVVYMAAGDTKKAQKSLASTTKKAKDYEDLAKLGAALTLVDLELSNKLFIHALSHKSAAEGDTTVVYAALIQGLIEVGENEAAADLLGKVSKETGIFKLLQARLALMTRDFREARSIVDDVLFTEPGRCMVYGLGARLAVLDGDTAEALEQYRAASLCSPNDLEARYYVADLEAQRGDLAAARRAVDAFLMAAAPRKNDPVRDARRQVMESAKARYDLDGVILLNVSCRATVCQGQVFNSTDAEVGDVKVAAFSSDSQIVGNSELEPLPAHAARPFMVRLEGSAATVTAGRNDVELKANMTQQSN